MKRKTNNERIIEYMRTHGSITSRDAIYDLGIFRLSARIFEIRKMMPIMKRMESRTRPDGTTVHWAIYSIREENEEK